MNFEHYKIVKPVALKFSGLLIVLLVFCTVGSSFGQQSSKRGAEKNLRETTRHSLYWFSSSKTINQALDWLEIMESDQNAGIDIDKAKCTKLRIDLYGQFLLDSISRNYSDRLITEMVLTYIKIYQMGNVHFRYDEVSVSHDSEYRGQLLRFKNSHLAVRQFLKSMDCKDDDYQILSNYLRDSITPMDTIAYRTVLMAMNYRKYFSHQQHSEFIIVNIPAASLSYYKGNILDFEMRTVVGKKTKPTPIIASYLTSVVAFPFWNAPRSITLSEILPKVKEDPGYLEEHHFEVIDSSGKVIDADDVEWEGYHKNNFPYHLRQSSGSDNALGLLKFVLKNPYKIYLHGTNNQVVFAREHRFLSHGCIRLEEPMALAQKLLHRKIDLIKLKNRSVANKSIVLRLPHKVPVFITYVPLRIVNDKLLFLPDVYGVLR